MCPSPLSHVNNLWKSKNNRSGATQNALFSSKCPDNLVVLVKQQVGLKKTLLLLKKTPVGLKKTPLLLKKNPVGLKKTPVGLKKTLLVSKKTPAFQSKSKGF